jgi:hypothetical protein
VFLKFGAAEEWSDLVRNKLVHRVKEERNILGTILWIFDCASWYRREILQPT